MYKNIVTTKQAQDISRHTIHAFSNETRNLPITSPVNILELISNSILEKSKEPDWHSISISGIF